MKPLLYSLILAHLIADFLQPAALVKKTKKSIKGLIIHVIIYTLLSAIVIAGYGTQWWMWLLALSVSHFLIDHYKYLLNIKFPGYDIYLFILDQLLHIGAIAFVVYGGSLVKARPSPFLYQFSTYWRFLPYIGGYIAGTFAVSIFIFDALRTFAHQTNNLEEDLVITLKYRLKGIIERAIGLTLIFMGFIYLLPVSFSISIFTFIKNWHNNSRNRQISETSLSFLSTLIIGIVVLWLV